MPPLDPRSVANTVIRISEEFDLPVTHLSLQKILYFLHGIYLIKEQEPLVKGYFEAWQYGPVHPLIYSSFKEFGAQHLINRATITDLLTGEKRIVQESDSREIKIFVTKKSLQFLQMSPGRLVDLSHAKGSPWDYLTRKDDGGRHYGVRITTKDILNSFKFHKVPIGNLTTIGEPDDESPPS